MPECCRWCGSIDLKSTIMDQGPHYSRIDCKDCGKFVKWGKKPEAPPERNQEQENTVTKESKKYTGGSCMNVCSIMGRLTKDPELRYTSGNNTAVCSFTLAIDRDYQKEGQEREADFIPCIVWEKKGEAAARLLEKGRRVGIVGRIQTRNWDDEEGKKHYVTEIVVQNWYFADDKKKETGSETGNNTGSGSGPAGQQQGSSAGQQQSNPQSNPPQQQGGQPAGPFPWEKR